MQMISDLRSLISQGENESWEIKLAVWKQGTKFQHHWAEEYFCVFIKEDKPGERYSLALPFPALLMENTLK